MFFVILRFFLKQGKKSMIRNIVTPIFLLLTLLAKAQDPELSQFYASPLYTNPALAGTGECNGGGRASLNQRNQWPNLPGAYITTVASFDQHLDAIGGGIGFVALRDVAGEGLLKTYQFSGIYSYQLNVSRDFTMRFGIEGQIIQRSVDMSKLLFEDMIDQTRGFVKSSQEQLASTNILTPNFNAGVVAYTKDFYFGFAAHNVIEPNQSFYGDPKSNLPRRYTAHGGMVVPLDKRRVAKSTFSPNILFMKQDQFSQLNAGFYINRGPLVTGLWYRQTFGDFKNSDAAMVLVGFRKDQFKFGYSFDLTVSSARAAAPGSHEISASVGWCARKPTRRFRPISCPDF